MIFSLFCLILCGVSGVLTSEKLSLILSSQQHQSHCGQERIITIDEESCLCKIEDRILKKPTALLYQYCLYISIRISFSHRKRCGCFVLYKWLDPPTLKPKGGYTNEQSETLALVDTKISTDLQTNPSITESLWIIPSIFKQQWFYNLKI